MAAPAVAKIALNISSKLVMNSKKFQKGVSRSISDSGNRMERSGKKITAFQKGINAENKKQYRMQMKLDRDKERDGREALSEAKKVIGPVGNLVNNIVKKPLQALWQLVLGWAVMNLPAIIKAVKVFYKKIRVFVGSINKAIRAAGGVFQGMIKVLGAFFQNVKELDFEDKSGRIEKARDEMLAEMETMGDAFSDMKNVWNKDEEELDKLLASMDAEKAARELSEQIAVEEGAKPQPQETATGRPAPTGGTTTGGSTRSGKVGALLDTISYAEGTSSYGTIYGGAVVPELAAGELSIGEVLSMQKTGKVRGRDAGYVKDKYDSDATGRYQFMSYVLEEEARIQGIPLSAKFTPALQDQMILARLARMRGVTEEKIETEGLSTDVIDRLAPEFASFPNLIGPDAQGNVGTETSYYGQGGKSQEQLSSNFEKNLDINTPKPDDAPAQPSQSIGDTSQPQIESGDTSDSTYSLVNKVPYADFSKTAAEGGKGAIGKTDGYNQRRGGGRIHKGIDIGTSGKKNVGFALLVNGRVTYVGAPDGLYSGAGRMIIIADGSNSSREYVFMHMERIFLKQGQAYKAGTVIGEIGNTGGSHGEHLHFEVRINNSHIDPGPFLKLLSIGDISRRTANANITGTATERSTELASAAASNRTNEGGQSRTRTNVIVTSQDNYIQVA